MKINIISDLHCSANPKDLTKINFYGYDLNKLESADYLIIAGDLGTNLTFEPILNHIKKETKDKFKDVLFIRGNHDYYSDYEESTDFLKYKFLDLVDNDVAFIGCTLWTPYKGNIYNEVKYMNDFRYITNANNNRLMFGEIFNEESSWLRDKFIEYKKQNYKIVIVTHHNPRSSDILPEDSFNSMHWDVAKAYWANDELEDINPDIWICGHIHTPIDILHNGVRFIRNPIGYRHTFIENDNKSWYNKVIEI